MEHSPVYLNVIPLHPELYSIRCSFYRRPREGQDLIPLNPNEMPVNLRAIHKEPLYTDFEVHEGADLTVTVHFEQSPNFARHYLNARIYRWFEGKARLRRKNFIKNNELYFLKTQDEEQQLNIYDRYTLRMSIGRMTGGPELTVMYGGMMKVWNKSILSYPGSSRDFSKVTYNGHLYRYEELIERPHINRRELYPVINRDVGQALGLPPAPWKRVNKIRRHTRHIDDFYNTWVQSESFQQAFRPSPDGFMSVKAEKLRRIDEKAANLLFGEGVTGRDPYQGMKDGGPYKPPLVSHLELFLIVAEEDARSVGNRLYTLLKKGLGHFPGLKEYARIPVHVSEHNITFRNQDDPLPEIKRRLNTMDLEENVQYGAVYISPIDKHDPDPAKHRVYYRMKEELLRHGVTSQVIDRKSVLDPSFAYYLPNISVALLAKLGGIPWTLERRQKKELVIGVGAYSPNRFSKTYLGSAFCFSNDGDFRGFDSFTADDSLMLAGSFQKAIKQFKQENDQVERIVIHYYKQMSREESRLIMDTMRELKLDVPVVILTIHKTGSTDLVLTDRDQEHNLPLSGTYMRSGFRQFLLCTNARFGVPGEKLKSYPYPIKVYVDLGGEGDLKQYIEDEQWVHELLEQVYQFSRLSWQSVSIQSLPVTIKYPEMVAEKFPYFEEDTMPEFGKRNFWFL